MAMTMTGEATLPAARPKVWALLNDPETLKACIPGCETLERVGDTGFTATAKVKIGPVSAKFKGKVELTDIVPDVGYTISGEGEGGIAGFAKGGAKVQLSDVPDGGTLLSYNVEAHVGGKMAQLGSRMIDGVAKQMADKFFANFGEIASKAATPADVLAHPPHGEAHVTHHFSEGEPHALAAPLEPSAASAPATARPAPARASTAVPASVSPPKKKSWFRRIWEWFTSR